MENETILYVQGNLPKNCLECPCFNCYQLCCGLEDGENDYFKDEIDGGICPLKETKQLINEVLKKIKIKLESYSEKDDTFKIPMQILEEVKKEYNNSQKH